MRHGTFLFARSSFDLQSLTMPFNGALARTNCAVQAARKFVPSRRGRGGGILRSNDSHTKSGLIAKADRARPTGGAGRFAFDTSVRHVLPTGRAAWCFKYKRCHPTNVRRARQNERCREFAPACFRARRVSSARRNIRN